ncbi:MAG: hypothetical protein ACI4VQ_01870 [Clostridia bacterium]
MSELILENNLNNPITNEKEQRNFLQTNIGKAINTGLDIGIRYILPDLIEDEVIEIKDAFIENGFKEGIQTAIDSAINLGKSALGIVTGNFENVNQMQTAVKTGGIIDSVSDVLDYTINKVVEKGKINSSVGNVIKQGKNSILNNVTKNIENEFEHQIDNIEQLDKYIDNWKNYFNDKNFEGMEKEYNKINSKIKEIAPIEKTIQNGRTVENLHKLIKNNNQNFDLTQEQLELANML